MLGNPYIAFPVRVHVKKYVAVNDPGTEGFPKHCRSQVAGQAAEPSEEQCCRRDVATLYNRALKHMKKVDKDATA